MKEMETQMDNAKISQAVLPTGTQVETPTEFYQPINDQPTEIRGDAEANGIRLTSVSPTIRVKQNAVVASHWLNTPMMDGALFCAKVFKLLSVAANNYDRTHAGDSFFNAYPDLVMLTATEATQLSQNTVNATFWFRQNYELLCVRVANRLWHYFNACCMYSGSLANMCILSRLNGQGVFKYISSVFKSANINTIANVYPSFPKPQGLESYIIEHSRYAVGMTSYFASIISVPLWSVDVSGNRGTKLPDLRSFIAVNKSHTKYAEAQDLNTLSAALDKYMMETITQYVVPDFRPSSNQTGDGYMSGPNCLVSKRLRSVELKGDIPTTSNEYKIPSALPANPEIENGMCAVLQYDDGTDNPKKTNDVLFSTNRHNYQARNWGHMSGTQTVTDNLVNKVQDNFFFWQQYMLEYFPDFTNPESDWNQLFINTEGVKLLESSFKVDPFFTAIRKNDAYDMLSLATKMMYKHDNKPVTATIVKWVPILDRGIFDHDTGKLTSATYLDVGDQALMVEHVYDNSVFNNWERYDPRNKTVFEYLKESQQWPHLTPTIFDPQQYGDEAYAAMLEDGSAEWMVKNCMPEASFLAKDATFRKSSQFGEENDSKLYPTVRSPTGAAACIMDILSTSTFARDVNSIQTIGISAKSAAEFVKSNDAKVFSEFPFQPFVFQQPLIDCTDLYQCGFNILITSDNVLKNEWSTYFVDRVQDMYWYDTNDNSHGAQVYPTRDNSVLGEVLEIANPSHGSAEGFTGHHVNLRHVGNAVYFDYIKTALIFVGAGVFDHPIASSIGLTSGNPLGGFYVDKCAGTGLTDPSFDRALVSKIRTRMQDALIPWFGTVDAIRTTWLTNSHLEFAQKDAVDRMLWWFAYAVVDHFIGTDARIYDANLETTFPWIYVMRDQNNQGHITSSLKLAYVYFDPRYGSIKPITYDTPKELACPNTVCLDLASDPTDNDVDVAGVAKFRFGAKVYGSPYDDEIDTYDVQNLITLGLSWSRALSPQSYYLWFIDNYVYNPICVDRDGTIIREDVICKTLGFGSPAKAGLALYARSRVAFPGIEDTEPFWGYVAGKTMKADDVSINKTGFMNDNDLVFKPRVDPKIKSEWNSKVTKMRNPTLRTAFDYFPKGTSETQRDSKPVDLKDAVPASNPDKGKPTKSKKDFKGYKGKKKFASKDKAKDKENESFVDPTSTKTDAKVLAEASSAPEKVRDN